MAAELKCFLDPECTQEIVLSNLGEYILRLAPMEGLNGYTGITHKVPIYLKNTGTRAALHVTSRVLNDNLEFVTVDLPEIGDLMELEVVKFTITITIPRWTRYQIQLPQIVFDYYTLPSIDEVYHNPYQDKREVYRYYNEDSQLKIGAVLGKPGALDVSSAYTVNAVLGSPDEYEVHAVLEVPNT